MIDMEINRIWAMPNSRTFQIKPIRELIDKYAYGVIVDPFANSNKIGTITNDIDGQYDTDYHMDAFDFLKMLESNSVDTVLYDPPYSPRQVSECYTRLDKTVNMQTTQASYWSKQKEQIGRIVKKDGIVTSSAASISYPAEYFVLLLGRLIFLSLYSLSILNVPGST